ncbi:MAG: metallopeptidase family protein [Thermoguttaceae bacterium]
MNPKHREMFDKQVDYVMKRLPKQIHAVLERIPLFVEDYPSQKMMDDMKIKRRDGLCGCFVGKTISHLYDESIVYPGFVAVFRAALISMCRDENGKVDVKQLREQIRITILHEIAHYHDIDEEELQKLGYG